MLINLIINADDFGFSSGVNRGIIECLEGGLLLSATIMVNTPGSREAIAYARGHPEFGFGLHLNLSWGRPVSGYRPSLCSADGAFLPSLRLISRLGSGRANPLDLEAEIRAQLNVCCDQGIVPTHVDGHKHIHTFRAVYTPLLEIAEGFGVCRFRVPRETLIGPARWSWKARLLRHLSKGLAADLTAKGLPLASGFCGSGMMGRCFTREHLVQAIRTLPGPVSEIMVHPGRPESAFRELDPYVEWREREIDVLGSPLVREAMQAAGVRLADFRSLKALHDAPIDKFHCPGQKASARG